MAYMQLAQPYQSGQNANPFGAFVAGEQQAQQLQLDKQRQQANQLALLQAQQQADQANQLDQLAPSIYTTTDPTQRAQLQSQLAGLGGAGRAEAGAAGRAWSAQSAAQQARLLQGATQAAQLAFSAQSVQDPAQQAMILAQARQAIAASGADPKAVASLEAMDPQTQMRVIENGAMTMKQLAAQNAGPDLSKPVDVFASDGSTHQMVNVNGRLVPISQYIGQGQNPATNALDANGAATPALVGAVKHVESNGNPNAVSPAGAVGVMQVMPATASSIGFPNADLRNPQVNEQIGTQYLNQQIQKYRDPSLALAAYNAGPGTVDRLIAQHGNSYAAIAPHLPQETQAYVPKVLGQLNAGPTPATALNAPTPPSPAQQGVQAALGHALQTMAQPVGQQQPQATQPPTGQPAQPTTPEQQVQVNMKLLALQQQNGIMTLPQIMRATNASPQLAQAVTALSGLNPTVGLDMHDPVILNRIGMAMTKAAQQAPHLMPANVASVAQAAPQPVAQPVAPAPAAPPVPQAPVQFGVKPAATAQGDVIAQRAQQIAELKARGVQFTPQDEQEYLMTGKGQSVANSNSIEAPAPGDTTLSGADYVASLPTGLQGPAQMLAEGKEPWPTGTVLRSAYGQQLVAAARHINPNVDATSYPSRLAVSKSVAAGPLGNSTNAFNTALQHANALVEANQSMDVSNLPIVGSVDAAKLKLERNNAYNTFLAGRMPFASEMARAYKGGAPAEGEIEQYYNMLDPADGQKAIAQRLQTYTDFLYSKALANARQYQQGMREAGIPYAPLPPETLQAIQRSREVAMKAGVPQTKLDEEAEKIGVNAIAGSPAGAAPSQAQVSGPIAVNPQTGERMQLVNGQWVKF
jgi:soluble lytic murein transglycosylase-like protein